MQIDRYQRNHLEGVLVLCRDERWPTFVADPERAHRALTAPGVITLVARENDEVIGFAQVQSDGEVQAHLTLLSVSGAHRRMGVGRRLVEAGLKRSGALRLDLVTDSADDFYSSFPHVALRGYRLYPA